MPRMERKIVQGNPIPILNMHYDESINRAIASSMNYPLPVAFGDSASIDAFGRGRVSEPYTVFDSKLIYDKNALYFDEVITNTSGNATSTYDGDNAQVQMYVEASDEIIRQTYQRFNYQPGKGTLSFLTYNMMGYANGCIKRVGLFDENNGVFCEINGDTLSYVIRKNGVDRGVPQWAWNQDTLNGSEDQSNPSGIEIDMTKTQISIIDFEWLGVGRVRVGFVIDGIPIYVHEFNHANVETSVYMSTPNLPVRYEVSTMGESCRLNHICSTVISEGGVQPNGSIRFMDSGSYVNANVAATEYVICGIRLKTTHFDTQVDIERMSLLATTNVNFRWRLHLDPTTSAALTWADVPNSSIQFGVGALDPAAVGDTITTAGTIIGGGFGSNNVDVIEADIKNALRLGASIGGVPNEIILAVTPYTNNEDIYGAFEWREI